MSKLLNKPFKAFTVYAMIILACSIPIYYYVIDSIWLNELDEHNYQIKKRIENGFKDNLSDNEINNLLHFWNTMQAGTQIVSVNEANQKKDSVYTITKQNALSPEKDKDRFRGLSSYLKIKGSIYHLTIETNVEESDETISAIAFITFLFFIILIIGFIFLNKQISKNVWQPFRKTLNQLKSYDLTKQQNIHFDQTDIEEFRELNQSLNMLIDKNISAFKQQKVFIENASHELQTPLAILKSKLDLLLQDDALTVNQSKLITAINLPLARVTRLNKNLLLLAKLDNKQFAENENVELTEIIRESIEFLSDYLVVKEVRLETNMHNVLPLFCNKTLLEICINNLIANGIVHNIIEGKLMIHLANRVLIISNSGNAELHTDRLFKRFSVSSSEAVNSGLGLAIVKEICNRYGWQVQYIFENKMHRFIIRF